MSKPYVHAKSSARKFGGVPEDYLAIHDFMDSSKSAMADPRHRAILHTSFGCFIVEKVFGTNIKNSDGRDVSVRAIAEQHCAEDYGGFIPAISDFLNEMEFKPWMNGQGKPPSYNKLVAGTKNND